MGTIQRAFPALVLLCLASRLPAGIAEYAAWIRPYEVRPLGANFGGEQGEVRLAITAIEGDDRDSYGVVDYSRRYGGYVSTDGRRRYFYRNVMGTQGGGDRALPDADQKRLDTLLADLPDDRSYLPPPNRRLVVQVVDGDRVKARVYDRSNAPDKVWEIIRLTGIRINSWVSAYKANYEWTVDGDFQHGALALSADGRHLISAGIDGPFQFWHLDTHARMQEYPNSSIPTATGTTPSVAVSGLSFSPDGSVAVVEGAWAIDLRNAESFQGLRRLDEPVIEGKGPRWSRPQFTSDGRYLLVQTNQPALVVFDTKTWERVSSLASAPASATGFFPSPRGERSVYVAKGGEIALWDPGAKHNIAILDAGARVAQVVYSPDESMVAVVTVHGATEQVAGTYRARIWRTEDGAFVHELGALEYGAYDAGEVLWWPDGKYVVAGTRSNGSSTEQSVGIWSVTTGRQQGELTGCPTRSNGIVLLPGERLAQGCADGKIRVWETSEIIKKIGAFEASLH
jgi:WD40 repeat protein